MGMRKLQSVERVEVVPAREVEGKLARVGATSAKELTDTQRVQAHLLDK